MIKLFIAVANSQDFVPARFHWSWDKMDKPEDFVRKRFDHSYGCVRQNQAVDTFLKSDCDTLHFMDIDQAYPRNYLRAMIPLAEKYCAIGPLIYNKWRKNNFPPLMCSANKYPFMSPPILGIENTGVREVPYAHNNMFYAREVLEKITPPWFDLNLNENGTARMDSGDFRFNDRVKEAGYKIYINTDILVQHLVMINVDTRLHNKWNGKE
jgi:hypothetical protein